VGIVVPDHLHAVPSIDGGMDLKPGLAQHSLQEVADVLIVFNYYCYPKIFHCYP
jgi:hypothetical protein